MSSLAWQHNGYGVLIHRTYLKDSTCSCGWYCIWCFSTFMFLLIKDLLIANEPIDMIPRYDFSTDQHNVKENSKIWLSLMVYHTGFVAFLSMLVCLSKTHLVLDMYVSLLVRQWSNYYSHNLRGMFSLNDLWMVILGPRHVALSSESGKHW